VRRILEAAGLPAQGARWFSDDTQK
jgi:hypothetical protein